MRQARTLALAPTSAVARRGGEGYKATMRLCPVSRASGAARGAGAQSVRRATWGKRGAGAIVAALTMLPARAGLVPRLRGRDGYVFEALGKSRERLSGVGAAHGTVLVPRCAAKPRVRSTHPFDGIVALAGGLEPGAIVRGPDVADVEVSAAGGPWRQATWDDLDRTVVAPGRYRVRFPSVGGTTTSLEIPACAGRARVDVDGHEVAVPHGPPAIVPLSAGPHEVVLTLDVTSYEQRIACGDRPRAGTPATGLEGLLVLTFASPAAARGGGRAVVYLPPGHDLAVAAPLLVGLHPWNGSMWTYAAYAGLIREARARDVLLLMPSGLGNSLYTADGESETMRAIEALSSVAAVDRRRVSIWGASMGGAGATTIGFHHPDRFASITSFFGDSKYDLTTYVRSLLPSSDAAHLVNALDVVENARNVPVWLVHGEQDRTSPIRQSEMLAEALKDRGFRVRFDRAPGEGHSGRLVARFLPELVASAGAARSQEYPSRVTFRSVRGSDTEAYGVRIVRDGARGDAFVDVALRDDAVHVQRAEGVRAIVLGRGALGANPDRPPRIVIDESRSAGLDVRWEP